MKIFFTGIILLHALIHLLGFMKAFGIWQSGQFTFGISKLWGVVCLLAGLALGATAVLYYTQNNYWLAVGILAMLISQLMIIVFGKDARYGTIPNLLLLALLIVQINARASLNMDEDEEVKNSVAEAKNQAGVLLSEKDLASLPPPVRRWLMHSGAVGKPMVSTVRLTQKCLLKLKPEQQDWYEAQASQFFSAYSPAFIWKVKMKMGKWLSVTGRDKLNNGSGAMLINLASVLPMVDEKNNAKLNEGSLQRYLGEIVWFPSAALSPYIHWEPVDEHSARATIRSGQTTGSGVFYFDEAGNFSRYVCERYMNSDASAKRYAWEIKAEKHKSINGINVPSLLNATWHLENGDWTWAKFEVTSISYQP